MYTLSSCLLVFLQIAVAKPLQNEGIRLSHPPPPRTPPSSPTAARIRHANVLRRRKSSMFPAQQRHLRPYSKSPVPAIGGARLGPTWDGHLLGSLTVEPALRGRDRSSAAEGTGNNWKDMELETEFRLISPQLQVVDRSHKISSLPLSVWKNPESSWTAEAVGKKLSTTETAYFVNHLSNDEAPKDSDAARRCTVRSPLHCRGVYGDEPKDAASLPQSVALRRNRFEKSDVIHGLPSKTIHTLPHQQIQMMPQNSQLPEVLTAQHSTVCVVDHKMMICWSEPL